MSSGGTDQLVRWRLTATGVPSSTPNASPDVDTFYSRAEGPIVLTPVPERHELASQVSSLDFGILALTPKLYSSTILHRYISAQPSYTKNILLPDPICSLINQLITLIHLLCHVDRWRIDAGDTILNRLFWATIELKYCSNNDSEDVQKVQERNE